MMPFRFLFVFTLSLNITIKNLQVYYNKEYLEKRILRGNLNSETKIQSVRAFVDRFTIRIKLIETAFDSLKWQ